MPGPFSVPRLAALLVALALPLAASAETAPAAAAAPEPAPAETAAPAAAPAEAKASASAPAKVARPVFSPGEEMVYRITALGMTAGRARISVGLAAERNGVQAWPVMVQARTDSLFDSIYSIRDRFVTWWHPETGRVVGSDFYADENGKRHRSTSKLDHESGKAEVLRIREWNGHRSNNTYDIPTGAYDIAGAVFALRGRPLQPGSVEVVDVFTGKKVFQMRTVVEGTERLKTRAGTYDAIVTRISLGFDGQFASKRDVRAWFSNDERHLPLRFEAEFVLGSVVAELLEEKRGIRL